MVCNRKTAELKASKKETLRDFIERIKESMRLQNPSIESSKGLLYIPKPQSLEEKHRHKLDLTFGELIEREFITGQKREEYEITDAVIATVVYAFIDITD